MDKVMILNKIKEYKNFTSDADFARFLEITPQNLARWKDRNTFNIEVLYTKCLDFINAEWLLTGQGSMLKEPAQSITSSFQQQENDSEIIALLKDKITLLEDKEVLLKDKIADLERRLAFAEVKDKEEMSLKIKTQRKENKAKDEIILAQTNTINLQNKEINALKSRHLPPDEPLQPTKRV